MSLLQIYIPEHFTGDDSPLMSASPDGQPSEACRWVLRDQAGAVLRRGEGPLVAMPKADSVQAVVPASMVLLAQVKVPSRNRRKMFQLLPYIVEEKLMYDPDSIHVAAGPQLPGGETVVAVIDKAWMKRVIGALQSAGLPPWRMWPETLMPAVPLGTWTVVWNGREGFVRTGMVSGQSLDGGSAEAPPLGLLLAAKEAAEKGSALRKINLILAEGSDQPDLESWASRLDVKVEVTGAWDWSAAAYGMEKGVNLLQGEFTPARFESGMRQRLRIPMILVGIIIALQFGGGLADWLMLNYEKRQLDAYMQKSFRQAFPEAKAVVDAPLQMQRNLAELRHVRGLSDPVDFLPVLAKAAPILSQPESVSIQSMQYENGILRLDVHLQGSQTPGQVRSRFQSDGMKADIEKVETPKSGGTIVRLMLRGDGL
ncbi:general secretion pathway protein L [Sulfuricella sp. T08]|uniref:type II secretion system protein GspL n=1 Tax=Sulfuricella sp. T08 TaxID=1632857 RepID=UPI0006179836|nr:type II secretion system protein GspL [Sulfuricella sp. T08]GAO34650.1 general secretion pathway protein L [Sulfuricella sp. T08]